MSAPPPDAEALDIYAWAVSKGRFRALVFTFPQGIVTAARAEGPNHRLTAGLLALAFTPLTPTTPAPRPVDPTWSAHYQRASGALRVETPIDYWYRGELDADEHWLSATPHMSTIDLITGPLNHPSEVPTAHPHGIPLFIKTVPFTCT